MRRSFESKADARGAVWDELQRSGVARFPYPPHGRIPNFQGAREAAERLLALPLFARARRIKVNPDAPQLPVRAAALARGIDVFMPTPRLRGGFMKLEAASIPECERRHAASLSGCRRFAVDVPLDALPELDAIVCGSVAVTAEGARAGKGEGYSDLEYAILRELGHPEVPVLTSVHQIQNVDSFPSDATDLPLHWIATPERIIEVADPLPAPSAIDWTQLDDEALRSMPVLAELRSGS